MAIIQQSFDRLYGSHQIGRHVQVGETSKVVFSD